ncbi:MAG: hypothetical protein JXB06_15125 [Spirochaetales bacterium]|nr:hypothetical protein [Spirochaetales bacterium]
MNTGRSTILMLGALIFLLCVPLLYSLEVYDHPEIGRYENSSIIHQESSNFNQYRLGLAAAQDEKFSETLTVEGKVTMTLYSGPEDASSFEIIRAYEKLLRSRDFEILFSCGKTDCGGQFLEAFYALAPFASDPGWNNSAPITQGNAESSYVLVAKSQSEETTMYVSIIVSQGWWSYPVYKLDVVEVQEFEGKISSVAGPEGETGDTGKAPPEPRAPVRRPLRFGLQLSSDSYFGFLVYANRFEVSAKAQAMLYDYPGSTDPDDGILMVGAHTSFLFKPTDNADLGVGVEVRRGIKLSGNIDYVQYMDGGPRLSLNYHLGEHILLSGVLYPAWVVVRETSVADSFTLDAKIPSAAVAVGFLF